METRETNIDFAKELAILNEWKEDLGSNIRSVSSIVMKSEQKSKLVFAESSATIFPLRAILGVASAMVVILFAVVLLQPKNSFFEGSYTTQFSKQDFNLSDGTKVVLDKSSELTPVSKRAVDFKGRGFFSVESSPSNPFNISTSAGLVQVLGTEFSLEVDGDNLELYVTEGVVKFEKDGKSAMVYAGSFIKVIDNNINLINTIPNNYLSWYENVMTFRSASVEEVISTINHHFDLSLTMKDVVKGEKSIITSRFINPDLQTVIDELAKNGCLINEKAL